MTLLKSLLILLFTLVVVSCKDTKNEMPKIVTVDTEPSVQEILKPTQVRFKDPKIATVFDAYTALRVSLVNTDVSQSSKAAARLKFALYKANAMPEVIENVGMIAGSSAIEDQRKKFEITSAAVEKMVIGSVAEGVLYKQYCPMAFGNKGASWLSDSKDIRNPYFGDKMLKCGRIDAEIK